MKNTTGKIKPVGFEAAAIVLTMGLSAEAANNLTRMVRNVAREYGHNDSAMLRTFRTRLRQAARRHPWAVEVTQRLEKTGGTPA